MSIKKENTHGGVCYCGHDCGRCLVYLATVTDEPGTAAEYRRQAQDFYRDTLHMEIPPEKLVCLGGHSDTVMEACLACPFRKCCQDRHTEQCRDCPDYPCAEIAAYEAQWVNKANQK